MDSTTETKTVPQGDIPSARWLLGGLLALAIGVSLGWAGRQWWMRERYYLGALRQAVEASAAPGELVVVDDRSLAWALTQHSGRGLKANMLSVSSGERVSSLLQELERTHRAEWVLVATPGDRLVQALDANGFQVAQEVGWVPWDVSGDGRSLLGRGRVRIFFVVRPQAGKRH